MDTPVCIRKPSHPYVSGRSLRSCDQNHLTVHHTRLGPKGDGAFATGSRPLHTLPLSLASVDSLITLKEQLKLIFLNLYLCNFLFLCSNIILLWSTWWMDQWIDQFHFYKRLYVWFFIFIFIFYLFSGIWWQQLQGWPSCPAPQKKWSDPEAGGQAVRYDVQQ